MRVLFYIYEMTKAANKWFTYGIWMMSPRAFDKRDLDIDYKLLKVLR